MKTITLITQDFHPIKGGIASYLMRIYQKYFSDQRFQAIVPRCIGTSSDYSHLPFEVYRLEFEPFDLSSERRQKTNKAMLDILHSTHTDTVLFGYIRSHPEVGLIYKKQKPHSRFGVFMPGKEAFIDTCVGEGNYGHNGSHIGYLPSESLFYRSILGSADYVFCVSKFTKNLLLSQGIQREFVVLYPPVPQTPEKENLRDNNNFQLLSVGRLIKRKGQQRVLEIIPQLLKKIPSLKYNIIGDGPERNNLLKTIADLHLEEQAHLQTNVSDLALQKIYSSSDVFVLPTDFIPPNDVEGLGIVFLEANMYSLPVIGGNTGGVKEAIVDGETGYLIDPRSPVELEERILDLYYNPTKRYIMGEVGRKMVFHQFSERLKGGEISIRL